MFRQNRNLTSRLLFSRHLLTETDRDQGIKLQEIKWKQLLGNQDDLDDPNPS